VTWIVAHRGASADFPENTMPAFKRAAEVGADAIECDVHLTADGKLAVIHDDSLDRTTNLSGSVRERRLAAIRKADAGANFTDAAGDHPFRGKKLKVPTLDEVLDWLPVEIGLVLEIKHVGAADAAVAARGGSRGRDVGRAVVISFDEAAIDRVHELDRELPTGYLLVPGQPFEPALRWAVEHGHTGVHPWEGDLGLDPGPMLVEARAFGAQVGCYVVNDPERMSQLAAYGLWGFVTDVPELARQTLGAAAVG